MQALQEFLSAIAIGVVSGSIYGLIGLGIVLIYKTQRVVNFAQAEFATLAAFVLYLLTRPDATEFGGGAGGPLDGSLLGALDYPLAGILAVTAAGLAALLVERVVIRPLRESRDVTVFVATAGVALLMISITFFIAGANILQVPSLADAVGTTFSGIVVGGFTISVQQLLVLAVLVVVAGLLAAFFKLPIGRALLAVSREPFAVRLAGISVSRLSMLVWVMGGVVAGLAGVAFAPTTTLLPGLFTSIALFPALTGAVLGGLTSLPGAFAGGIVVGIAQALAAQYLRGVIPGSDTAIVFVMLLAVLLVRPQGLLAREA